MRSVALSIAAPQRGPNFSDIGFPPVVGVPHHVRAGQDRLIALNQFLMLATGSL
jgi:hypothetical protein